jgi:hypothetical protein
MDAAGKDKRPGTPLGLQVVLCVGALGVMVGLMCYSITYPYPDGKSLDVGDFIALWLREIVIAALLAFSLLALLVGWLVALIRRLGARGKNAP